MNANITANTKEMIDNLKVVCSTYGLGNAPSEYKIITEIFLYKFLNDKFIFDAKKLNSKFEKLSFSEVENALINMNEDDYELFLLDLPASTAKLKKEHFISVVFNKQNEDKFHETFDNTLTGIADNNIDIFSVQTGGQAKMRLFGGISNYVLEQENRDDFCKAIIDKMVNYNFEEVFVQKYDFFSQIFEYLIKDYNKDFGKYAEYYTPHSISGIIAKIMVPNGDSNVSIYDPAAGSGTLVLSIAHEIGENNCTIYTQDISQKSSEFLRLNLILNNLVHSLPNVINSNTLTQPFHKNRNGDALAKFDYIVSNPPFKTDFSESRDTLASDIFKERFFSGVPKTPPKKKDTMSIYLLFLQHIIFSLNEKGKASVVVPTGFITAQSGIEKDIRKKLVDEKIIRGVVSMPSNIFANTGTNVSIIFIDRENKTDKAILIDASKLGTKVKEDKNQRTVLSKEEEEKIINTFVNMEIIEDLSVVVDFEEIVNKNYSLSAGQYFDVKINYVDITHDEFEEKMKSFETNLKEYFNESRVLEVDILKQLEGLKYE